MKVYCFPKTIRLRKRFQFQRLSQGKRLAGNWISSDSRENKSGITKLGITVTKRFGKAHERNRFKRLVREAFRLSYKDLKTGLDINIKPRSHAKAATLQNVKEDMIRLFGNDLQEV